MWFQCLFMRHLSLSLPIIPICLCTIANHTTYDDQKDVATFYLPYHRRLHVSQETSSLG